MKTRILFYIALTLWACTVNAQRVCQTNEKDKDARWSEMEKDIQNWISSHKNEKTHAVITIPVVIHIVHNGEAVGVGSNIGDPQIYSQLAIMNDMFRLKNADTLPSTHAFASLQADCQIEFCLAQQDEFGNPTTGIERINGGQPDWTRAQLEATLQPATIWNRNLYLNLWTAKFGGSNSSLTGYGSYPGGAANIDGVVISCIGFGNVGNVLPPFQYGKSCAHDIGHWLNLNHIWDQTCSDDQVADTPPCQFPNYGCPSFPHNPSNTCGSGPDGEMFMNYMDYVDDACMVMFTNGQSARMNAVLNTVRASLLTSPGCLTPATAVGDNDRKNDLVVYPNPSLDGMFTVQSSKFKLQAVEVTDVAGRIIKTLDVEQGTLDLSGIENGVYLLKVFYDNFWSAKPIVLQ